MSEHIPQYQLSAPDEHGRQTLSCTCGETWEPTSHRPLIEERKKVHAAAAGVVRRNTSPSSPPSQSTTN